MSDPSRTETLTAEQVQAIRYRGRNDFYGDVIEPLCDSHDALRSEVAKLQQENADLSGKLEKCAYRSAGFQHELRQAEAREQATREKVDEFRAWLQRERDKYASRGNAEDEGISWLLGDVIDELPELPAAAAARTDTRRTLTADDIAHGFRRTP